MSHPENRQKHHRPGADNRMLIGVVIIAVGSLLLLDKLDFFFFPSWLFSWPLILIVVGFVIGARQQFAGIGWIVMVVVGGYFLVQDFVPYEWNLRTYAVPLLIILIGALILFRSTGTRGRHDRYWPTPPTPPNPPNPYSSGQASASENTAEPTWKTTANGEDVIDLTAIFGRIKKRVFSKNFRGGDITSLFGGAELDFTQADINGQAHLDMTHFFGGATLIVPANWTIKSDLVAILGGINDKRTHVVDSGETNKTLVISGTAIFGGIEIKSY